VDGREFQTAQAYSNSALTNVKYSTYRQSWEENVKVIERLRPNSFYSYLFTCRLNSPEAIYKVSTGKKSERTTKYKARQLCKTAFISGHKKTSDPGTANMLLSFQIIFILY
jgi:hypothetical protein